MNEIFEILDALRAASGHTEPTSPFPNFE